MHEGVQHSNLTSINYLYIIIHVTSTSVAKDLLFRTLCSNSTQIGPDMRNKEILNMKNYYIAASILCLSMIGFNAYAHGVPQAQHGGVVQVASDLGFELVGRDNKTLIFVDDHGKPANVNQMQMTGHLTVLQGAKRTRAELVPTGINILQADMQLISGARVVATINRPNQTTITVRFVAK